MIHTNSYDLNFLFQMFITYPFFNRQELFFSPNQKTYNLILFLQENFNLNLLILSFHIDKFGKQVVFLSVSQSVN
jgi:hypothetical protein